MLVVCHRLAIYKPLYEGAGTTEQFAVIADEFDEAAQLVNLFFFGHRLSLLLFGHKGKKKVRSSLRSCYESFLKVGNRHLFVPLLPQTGRVDTSH